MGVSVDNVDLQSISDNTPNPYTNPTSIRHSRHELDGIENMMVLD